LIRQDIPVISNHPFLQDDFVEPLKEKAKPKPKQKSSFNHYKKRKQVPQNNAQNKKGRNKNRQFSKNRRPQSS